MIMINNINKIMLHSITVSGHAQSKYRVGKKYNQ